MESKSHDKKKAEFCMKVIIEKNWSCTKTQFLNIMQLIPAV